MPFPTLTELIPILQIAIGPVILISGVGLLVLSMTNRLGRAIDRARILRQELRAGVSGDEARTRGQLQILWHRADHIRQAIILSIVSALLAACLIIALFVATVLRLNTGWVIACLFTGCMVALIGSLVVFLWDINQALLALRLEIGDVLGEGESSSG